MVAAPGTLRQLVSFAVIGVLSTVTTLLLYALLRQWWPVLLANFGALAGATFFNTEANRRFTFGAVGKSTKHVHVQGFVVFGLYYAFTSAALLVLHAVEPEPARWLELTVLFLSSMLGTAGRFVLLRVWVFRSDKDPATSTV